MKVEVESGRFEEVVRVLRARFPQLTMDVSGASGGLDGELTIPEQPGLTFPVEINLQTDELHLSVGAFHVEWFPCGDQAIFDRFIYAVAGLLSGEFRIVEKSWRGTPVSASLEKPSTMGWERLAAWGTLALPLPIRKRERIIQNQP